MNFLVKIKDAEDTQILLLKRHWKNWYKKNKIKLPKGDFLDYWGDLTTEDYQNVFKKKFKRIEYFNGKPV